MGAKLSSSGVKLKEIKVQTHGSYCKTLRSSLDCSSSSSSDSFPVPRQSHLAVKLSHVGNTRKKNFELNTHPSSINMVEFTAGTMEKLAEMLRPPDPDVLQGDDLASVGYDITSTRDKIKPEDIVKTPRTIEEFEEQEAKESEELSHVGAGLGNRKTPQYTMNYQQAVSAEDVFLQIGPNTPSSASCENLIVRIKMPGDKKENVDLAVTTTSVTVNSSQHSLKLPLPHGINPDHSKASWDADQETLILTLKLDREFDFVNF